jgi:hypothetical protein
MNFDYFVERESLITEMARPVNIFGKFPEVKAAYINLYNQIKNSGDVNPSQTSQIRNRLYNITEIFLNQLEDDVMDYYKSVATNSNTRFANWASIMDTLLNQGKIDPNQLISYWSSVFSNESPENDSDDAENDDVNKDSEVLNYISKDDSDEVERLFTGVRLGANRRMKELTGGSTYPMSYLQYTKLFSYLLPRLKTASAESRRLKIQKDSGSSQEPSEQDLSNPYADVQGWIETAAETLKEGILAYKDLLESGEIDIDEVVDESGRPDRLAQTLAMWKRENFEKTLSDIVTSFGGLKTSPSPEQFMNKMVSLSDQMADSGNKSASALFMALGKEFRELYESEAPENYEETDDQPYIGFDTRALKKVFGLGEGLELFKAWYGFRKSLQDYNMEKLDFRKSNAYMDKKEQWNALASGTTYKPESNEQKLQQIAILKKQREIEDKQERGEDTTEDEKNLAKMEARYGTLGNREPVEVRQKNPWQKKIDDVQIKIQHAEESLQFADPAYAKELKNSIARMNAELEAYYAKASEWQPIQESVLSYMEEQVQKDNKFGNPVGNYVSKGYKRFKNYNHWLVVNE